MNLTLLIIIMSISRKHIYVNFRLEDAIYQPVLLGYLTAPAIFGFAFQWLGMACTCLGMLHKLVEQLDSFLETSRLLHFNFARSVSASGEKVILYIIIKH